MYTLILSIVALAGPWAVAHEGHRAYRAALVSPALIIELPRPGFEEERSAEVGRQRLTTLMGENRLRAWMFTSSPLTQDQLAYADAYPLIPSELAGAYVQALVNTELEMARKFNLPVAQVWEQTDMMIALGGYPGGRSRFPIVAWNLGARKFAPLGPEYDALFTDALAKASVFAYGGEVRAINAVFLPNLAKNFRRATSRKGLSSFSKHTATATLYAHYQDWLFAPLPAEVSIEDRSAMRQRWLNAQPKPSDQPTPSITGEEITAARARAYGRTCELLLDGFTLDEEK